MWFVKRKNVVQSCMHSPKYAQSVLSFCLLQNYTQPFLQPLMLLRFKKWLYMILHSKISTDAGSGKHPNIILYILRDVVEYLKPIALSLRQDENKHGKKYSMYCGLRVLLHYNRLDKDIGISGDYGCFRRSWDTLNPTWRETLIFLLSPILWVFLSSCIFLIHLTDGTSLSILYPRFVLDHFRWAYLVTLTLGLFFFVPSS